MSLLFEHGKTQIRFLVNLWDFWTECLGHKFDINTGYVDLGDEYKQLWKFLHRKEKFKLILMPRFSLKSCLVTIGYSLWRIVNNTNIRILIYSDSITKAQNFLDGVKNHILGKSMNSKFREIFGEMESDFRSGGWNESQIIVKFRTLAHVEPTVDTGGIESSKIGMHYDLIIFDDIVSDLNTTTKAQMDKTWDCYKKSLSLLKPGGEVIVVGTRWNFGDAYGRMIEENKGDWAVHIRQAEKDGMYPFEAVGLTKEFLQAQKERQGSYFHSCLYQNSPVDDSTALFKHEDFRFYGKLDSHENLFITCTCDPAGEGEDYTAITVVGTDKKMKMYLLYALNRQIKPSQIVNEIIRLSYHYKYQILGIETNFFAGMLEKELNLQLETERLNPRFRPFSIESFRATSRHGEGKHARILSLQPYHERNDLLFPGESVESLKGAYSELAYQMLQYTQSHKPLHDDILDSLSYHIQLIRRGYGEAESQLPENCVAALFAERAKELNHMQRHLPRRYRKIYEYSF